MPDLNDQHKGAVDRWSQLFEGNPKKKLVNVTKEGDEEDGGAGGAQEELNEEDEEGKVKEGLSDISEEEEIKIPPKDLTELDRLAFVVFAIENDCQICPVGAFKMTPTHQVRHNAAFKGLTSDAALYLSNY